MVRKRDFLAGLFSFLVGCASPARIDDMVRGTFNQSTNVMQVMDALDHARGGETGGIVYREGDQYVLEVIPNKYLRLLEIIDEFEQGHYANRNEFGDMLKDSREVHVRNSSWEVVNSIDSIKDMLHVPIQAWSTSYMRVVCQMQVVQYTYRPRSAPSHEAVYDWHSHLTSEAHSPIDLKNSCIRPELVIYSKRGQLIAVLAVEGKIRYSQVLSQPIALR